ncbi:MAG: CHAT domain-containing protein [Chloroflexi bacterium]|nr:MAG: CHAT domain-containing protein [Chloroflexota bacterium]
MSTQPNISSDLVQTLIQANTLAQQIRLLQTANLFHEDGLTQLLQYASELIRSDPGQARQLTSLLANIAQQANAPAIKPRANYLQAQTHAINGDFEQARQLIESARAEFQSLNLQQEALRTNIGLMHVLGESGQYQEALAAGQTILDTLAEQGHLDMDTAPPESVMLAAMAYQNSGLCHELMGRYEHALAAYEQAEIRFQKLGLTEHIGHIKNNRGVLLSYLGRVTEALTAFEEAAEIFAAAEMTLLHAQALINIGDAHMLLGNYGQSLDALEEARRLIGPIEALAEQHILLLDTANTYLALNLYPEAAASYKEAESLFRKSGMVHHQARALWGLGMALMGQRRFPEAEEALATAVSLFTQSGNDALLSSVLLEQAALLAQMEQRGEALTKARQALELAAGKDWPIQQVYAHLRLADLLLPDVKAAESMLNIARSQADELGLPHLRYRVYQRLGRVYLLQNRDEAAKEALTTAVSEIEKLRGTLVQEAIRASFLQDKIAAYEDLVQLYLRQNNQQGIEQAFSVAEQAKSRALIDLLTGIAKNQTESLTDSEIATRLQQLQADLNAIYNEALASSLGGERRVRLDDLHHRATAIEQEIQRLRLLHTGYAASPLQSIQSEPMTDLPATTTLLAYHIIGNEVIAFVRHNGRFHCVRQITTTNHIIPLLQQLQYQWERFRIGNNFVKRHLHQLELSSRRLLTQLYTQLIAPLKNLLPAATPDDPQPLAIIPHNILHQVPFHALFDGQNYLLEKYIISYAPSATILSLCQKRPLRPSNTALLFGIADPTIPHVTTEILAVAQSHPKTQIFLNQHATLNNLKQHIHCCNTIHLACHGLFRSGNPMFSALKLYDGWLTASDIMQLNLQGTRVILSACESGRKQILSGDEILGLTRAFLGAGAVTLIVSLWLVEDESTATLMTNLYTQIQKTTCDHATALRNAQIALKETHPHPYYWAPFILVGHS